VEKFERPIARAEQTIADHLPVLISSLLRMATGEMETVEERWEPAGLQTVSSDTMVGEGDAAKKVRQILPAFPGTPAAQLVMVSKTIRTAAPDVRAAMYLVDRILDRPAQSPPSVVPKVAANPTGAGLKITEVIVQTPAADEDEEERPQINT
jgi:hypothetical protein